MRAQRRRGDRLPRPRHSVAAPMPSSTTPADDVLARGGARLRLYEAVVDHGHAQPEQGRHAAARGRRATTGAAARWRSIRYAATLRLTSAGGPIGTWKTSRPPMPNRI